jgi:hypothetical protein
MKATPHANKVPGNAASKPLHPNDHNSSARSQENPGKDKSSSRGKGRRLDDDEIDFSSDDESDPVLAGASKRNAHKTSGGTSNNNAPRVLDDPSMYGVPPRKPEAVSSASTASLTNATMAAKNLTNQSTNPSTTSKANVKSNFMPSTSENDGPMKSIPVGNSNYASYLNSSTSVESRKKTGVALSTDLILASARLNEDVGFSSDDEDDSNRGAVGRGNNNRKGTAVQSNTKSSSNGTVTGVPIYADDDLLASKNGNIRRNNGKNAISNSSADYSRGNALDDDYDLDRAVVIPHGTLRVSTTPGMPPPIPHKGAVSKTGTASSASGDVNKPPMQLTSTKARGTIEAVSNSRQSHSAGGAVGAARALKSTPTSVSGHVSGQIQQADQQKRKAKASRKDFDFDADDDDDDDDAFGHKYNRTSNGRSSVDDIVSGGMALEDGDGEKLFFSSTTQGGSGSGGASNSRNGGAKTLSSSSKNTTASAASSKLGGGSTVATNSGNSRVIIKPGQRIQVRPGGKK